MLKSKKVVSMLLSIVLAFSICAINGSASNNGEQSLEAISQMLGGVKIVETSPLDPSHPDYWVAFYDLNHKTPIVNDQQPNPDTNYLPYEQKVVLPSVLTTVNTKYNVYSSNGTKKHTDVVSVFDAIRKATATNDYVRETDTLQTIFTKNNSTSTFYKFQFTKYYGTTNLQGTQDWVRDYAYTHVFDGTGTQRFNSYYSIKGIPDTHTLEADSGGYYYKYSYSYNGHKASENDVVFSNSDIRFASTDENNAYIYSAVQNSTHTLEIGIMSSKFLSGDWYVYKSDTAGLINFYPNKMAINSTLIATNTYRANGAVKIRIKLRNGGATGIVTSNILSESLGTVSLDGNSFTETGSAAFLQAASLVEVFNSGKKIADIRNGAYLKNVSFNNCKLYNNLNFAAPSYDFYGNSANTYFAFIYNEDTITYVRNSSIKETINIDYSVPYQE